MRHFYLSASFISIPDPVSGLKAGAYYIMWRSGKITRFWHCIFFYRFRKKFPTLRDKPLLRTGNPARTARHSGCRHLQSRQGFNGAFGRHVLPLFQTASVHLRAGMRRRSGRPLSGGLRSESRTASCTIIRKSAVFASHSEHCRHREQTRCRRHAYFHFSCQHHESKTYSRNLCCRGRERIASTRRQGKSSSDRPERDLYLWKLPRDSGLWGQCICFRSAG